MEAKCILIIPCWVPNPKQYLPGIHKLCQVFSCLYYVQVNGSDYNEIFH